MIRFFAVSSMFVAVVLALALYTSGNVMTLLCCRCCCRKPRGNKRKGCCSCKFRSEKIKMVVGFAQVGGQPSLAGRVPF